MLLWPAAFIGGVTAVLCPGSCFDSGSDRTTSEPKDFRGTWIGSTGDGLAMELVLNQVLVSVDGNAVVGNQEGTLTGSIDGTRIQNDPPRRLATRRIDDHGFAAGSIGGILNSFTVNLASR